MFPRKTKSIPFMLAHTRPTAASNRKTINNKNFLAPELCAGAGAAAAGACITIGAAGAAINIITHKNLNLDWPGHAREVDQHA